MLPCVIALIPVNKPSVGSCFTCATSDSDWQNIVFLKSVKRVYFAATGKMHNCCEIPVDCIVIKVWDVQCYWNTAAFTDILIFKFLIFTGIFAIFRIWSIPDTISRTFVRQLQVFLLGTCEASRFDSNSNRPFQFDLIRKWWANSKIFESAVPAHCSA